MAASTGSSGIGRRSTGSGLRANPGVAIASLVLMASACGGGGGPSTGAGTSSTSPPAPTVSTPSGPTASQPGFSRVVVVVMENKDYRQIIGNPSAPYVNSLADRSGLATNFHSVAHPSLPNYLALIGGSTFGVSSDCSSCNVDRRNLTDQLEEAGVSWKAYVEGLPSTCFLGATADRYAKKHNPFYYFDDIVNDPGRCAKVVPLAELHGDLADGSAPRFVWVTPDLCHDMHDCSISVGDRFLAGLLPPLIDSLGPSGILFLTWDESSSRTGPEDGHVATIVAGPQIRKEFHSPAPYTHYSILRTIQIGFGLDTLGRSATAPGMTAFFTLP